jgi:hypothetical protein
MRPCTEILGHRHLHWHPDTSAYHIQYTCPITHSSPSLGQPFKCESHAVSATLHSPFVLEAKEAVEPSPSLTRVRHLLLFCPPYLYTLFFPQHSHLLSLADASFVAHLFKILALCTCRAEQETEPRDQPVCEKSDTLTLGDCDSI